MKLVAGVVSRGVGRMRRTEREIGMVIERIGIAVGEGEGVEIAMYKVDRVV